MQQRKINGGWRDCSYCTVYNVHTDGELQQLLEGLQQLWEGMQQLLEGMQYLLEDLQYLLEDLQQLMRKCSC